jgi:hypothetical protein
MNAIIQALACNPLFKCELELLLGDEEKNISKPFSVALAKLINQIKDGSPMTTISPFQFK